jgi:Tfp pilus assembly protein PilF
MHMSGSSEVTDNRATDALLEALRHLERGDWEAAHVIVQEDPSNTASWAHGIVHLMEGDLDNAGYWYRRAGRSRPDPARIGAEIAALRAALEARGG